MKLMKHRAPLVAAIAAGTLLAAPALAQTGRPGGARVVGWGASTAALPRFRAVTKGAGTTVTRGGAGAKDLGGIIFGVPQASKRLNGARGRARADPRRKAEIYAKAAGVT